jgi:hypothetical protein
MLKQKSKYRVYMVYEYIKNIDNNDLFKYLVVIFGMILLLNRISPGINTIIGIITGVIFVYYMNDKHNTTGAHFISNMKNHLKGPLLNHTKYFYIDSELIQLMVDIKEYHSYNPFVYRKLVNTIDSFLHLVSDMEKTINNIGEQYQIITEKKHNAMNALHSMIYNIPQSEATITKYQHALLRLEELLNNHIDNVYQYMVYQYGKKPIDTNTKFIYKNHPKAVNASIDTHYDFY